MAKKEEKQNEKKDAIQSILGTVLKKGEWFNDLPPVKYFTSTGSLNLDLEMGGGLRNTFLRVGGEAETGKSSFTLNLIKNFLSEKNRKRRGIYFLSDKDVSDEMLARCGVKFVTQIEDFVDGTCLMVKTNIYETVCNTIKKSVDNNPDGIEFIFALDSMDNFAPKAALEVDFGESSQKGGTSAITAHFFRSFNMLLPALGHTTILISQFRDIFNMGKGPQIHKQMATSGGRSAEHGVAWAFQFLPAVNSKEDMFWEGEPYKSKKIGHNCILEFKKTTNEKTGTKVRYPIIYGRKNGNSIWVEKEIFDQLLIFEMVNQKGSWFAWDAHVYDELIKIDSQLPKQLQGGDAFVTYLESNQKLTEYIYNKLRKLVMNEAT